MLRQDMIEAVAAHQFHIYPIETIDQGIETLTGVLAGEADEDGNYPANSINGRVVARWLSYLLPVRYPTWQPRRESWTWRE